jgi:hypothetical protein
MEVNAEWELSPVEFRGSIVTKNGKKASQWFYVLVSVLRSVARRRLVETENPSACATVNCKLCKLATALYLIVTKRERERV